MTNLVKRSGLLAAHVKGGMLVYAFFHFDNGERKTVSFTAPTEAQAAGQLADFTHDVLQYGFNVAVQKFPNAEITCS